MRQSLAVTRRNRPLLSRTRSGALALLLATAACTDPMQVPAPPSGDNFNVTSKIASQSLSDVQIDNLALLAKVWGFAKYHDARVITGSMSWDHELFRVLPTVLDAADRQTATAAIVRWLDRQGAIRTCGPCASLPSNVRPAPDNGWITDVSALGAALSGRLVAIHRNRPADGQQRYVGLRPHAWTTEFEAESEYPAQVTPDGGYRLLALFRFWNIVQYWYPYRDVIGEPWENVLREYIPRMLRPMTRTEYRGAILQLSARINDSAANQGWESSLQPPAGSSQVPVALRFIDGKPVVTAYLDAVLGPATGLEIGDVIDRVDGVAVETLLDSLRPWYPASNESTRLRDIARSLLRGSGPVAISGMRASGSFEVTASRSSPVESWRVNWPIDRPGPAFQMLSDSVAYIKISTALRAEVSSYVTQALSARLLVIDVRGSRGRDPLFALGGHLASSPTPFAQFALAWTTNPGAFGFVAPTSLMPAQPRFTGTVVVLVGEYTLGAAEYDAMAFRSAPNAIVVGSTTAGSVGDISLIPLPGSIVTWISGIGVFYPNGTPTQRVGIVPDFEVRPTVAGIRAGRDEVLEAGIARGFAAGVSARAP